MFDVEGVSFFYLWGEYYFVVEVFFIYDFIQFCGVIGICY